MLFLALGIAAQVYLCHRLRFRPAVTQLLVVAALLVFIFSNVDWFPKLHHFLHRHVWGGRSFESIGPFFTMWCWVLPPVAVVFLLRDHVHRREFRPERRAFLTASAAVIAAAPTIALGAGFIIRKDFQVKEMDLKFPNLPRDLQGLRLVQLSDIHIGDFFTASDVSRVVDAANNLRADIVFVTGDLISTKWDPLDRCLLELSRLKSSAGIWGCLGNHEQHQKIEAYTTRKALEFDIRFLRQQSVPLQFGQSKINLVGVDHQRHDRPYLEGAQQLVAPGQFNLLLSHNPDVFPVAARQGFDLTLAGHTHGGQINLPLGGANLNIADLVTPYTKGFYKLPNSSLYVNCGLGTIGVPVRLGAPPEITVIRLCNS